MRLLLNIGGVCRTIIVLPPLRCHEGDFVFPAISLEFKTESFRGAPADNSVWIGEIIILHDHQEIVPVRFGTQDFWVGFTSPQYEAGSDPDLFRTFCENWSDGFAPADFSRLVKFARTESCDADRYKPDLWKLSAPEQVYQFSQTIGDAVVFHAETYPKCREYFFWPASGQLDTLYKRTFRYIDRDCLPQQFRPILNPTGVFNGYQRT